MGDRLDHVVAVLREEEELAALRVRDELNKVEVATDAVHVALGVDAREQSNPLKDARRVVFELTRWGRWADGSVRAAVVLIRCSIPHMRLFAFYFNYSAPKFKIPFERSNSP